MGFAEHHDIIKALAPNSSDQPFNVAILPERAWSRWPVANAHGLRVPSNVCAIAAVAIPREISGGPISRKGFGDLPGNPFRGRISRDIGPDEAPTI